MTGRRAGPEASAWLAGLASVSMIAHQIGGKATRDALFFTAFPIKALSFIALVAVVPTSLMALAAPKLFTRVGAARAVTWGYLASAGLHLVEWALRAAHRDRITAVVLFLHIMSVPLLTSAFWSILSDGIDPRASRRQLARAALAASVGGVVGGLLAAVLGVAVMLPVLACLHLACAAGARSLSNSESRAQIELDDPGPEGAPTAATASAHGRNGYLLRLAAFVLLLAMTAALLDYSFKGHVQAQFHSEAEKMRLFSSFYASTSLLALVFQLFLSRRAIERAGLVQTTAALPFGVALGCLGAIAVPGLASAATARGAEYVLRNSLFRSAYEPLYNAMPSSQKNASKTIVDVGVERTGDALGYGVAGAISLVPMGFGRLQVAAALALAIAALLISRMLRSDYAATLRTNLLNRAVRLDPALIMDTTTTRVLTEIQPSPKPSTPSAARPRGVLAQIATLKGGSAEDIRGVLGGSESIPTRLVPHVIPLLARDDVAGVAIGALRATDPPCTGLLVERLLDSHVELAARRRIPRVLAGLPSARAVEGLVTGLAADRFEVRLQCGRSLARMRERHPAMHVPRDAILLRISREVEVERALWAARQIIETDDDRDSPLLDVKLRRRANRSLEHVFNLLGLILPHEPLRLAFRALHTDDPFLRGTALEYLETVLPRPTRDELWPFLEADERVPHTVASRQAALAALQRVHESVEVNLTSLQHRVDAPRTRQGRPT